MNGGFTSFHCTRFSGLKLAVCSCRVVVVVVVVVVCVCWFILLFDCLLLVACC